MIIFGMSHYTAIRFLLKLLRLMSVGGCGSRFLVVFCQILVAFIYFFKNMKVMLVKRSSLIQEL